MELYYTKQRQGRLAFRNAVRVHVDNFTAVKRIVSDKQLSDIDTLTIAYNRWPTPANLEKLQQYKLNLV